MVKPYVLLLVQTTTCITVISMGFNDFMNTRTIRSLLILLIFTLFSVQAIENHVYGLYEAIDLPELDITVKAKLDTGAKTSSLGATDIKTFKKDGVEWVSFKPQIAGKTLPEIEKLLVRHSNIKRRVDDINQGQVLHTKRPVVMLQLCFDGEFHTIEVNLADRSRFVYPLLIGSKTLIQLKAVVDPRLKYQAVAKCNEPTIGEN